MEFVKPEAFAVAYKSRYVAKPVEAAAAMQATFDKRYEDAVGYGDIIKQTVAAAKPETTAQLAEVTRIATEAQAKLQAAIDSGDVRNVDLEAKRIATDFASDPRISIIARSAEMIRKQDEERQILEMRGEPFLKITDESRENFLGYTPNEDGSLNAQKVPTFYAKKLDWTSKAKMSLTSQTTEQLMVGAKGGNPESTALLKAVNVLSSTTTTGVSAEQIKVAAVAYAPSFLSTAEGAQYISAVRSGQAAPVGVSPNQAKKLADYTDEQLAELLLISVNAPQIFKSIAIQYEKIGASKAATEGESESAYTPAVLDNTKIRVPITPDQMFEALHIISPEKMGAASTVKISRGQGFERLTPMEIAADQKAITDNANSPIVNAFKGLKFFREMSTGVTFDLASNAKEIQKVLEASSAIGINQFSNTKAGNTARKVANESHFSIKNSTVIWRQATGSFISIDGGKDLLTITEVQAMIKKVGNVEIIGEASAGNSHSFYPGFVIRTPDNKQFIGTRDLNFINRPDVKLESLVGAVVNAYQLGVDGGVPMIRYNVVDGEKLSVSVKPYNTENGVGGTIIIKHGENTATLHTSLLTPENISRLLEQHYIKEGQFSWGK